MTVIVMPVDAGTVTTMTTPGQPLFRDFTPSGDAPSFTIGDDRFVCVLDMDIDDLEGLTKLATSDQTNTTQWREQLTAVARTLLEPASASRFIERIQPREVRNQQAPPTPGIGLRTLTALIPWLIEAFGLVPTQPSSESSSGSADDGTGSTDGPQPTE